MADPLSPEVSQRICRHMNKDHADAVLLYVKAFANQTEAVSAEMIALDTEGMDLTAKVKGQKVPVRIPFDHTLQDSEDAHQTLITMVKHAHSQVVGNRN
mgnify:CR=1 FL=1